MGSVIAKLIFKTGMENIQIKPENVDKCLWDYTVTDIDGNEVQLR
jgi:hypothetical protein